MDISIIIERAVQIGFAIIDNPLIYIPLIGSWIITASYFIINHDERHGHTYVMSTGIAHIFTAYMVSPLAMPGMTWNISNPKIIAMIVLLAYGIFLTICGVMKTFPDVLAEFFGDPGHALIPSMMVLLYLFNNISFDWSTFIVIAVPVLVVSALKIYRRYSNKGTY